MNRMALLNGGLVTTIAPGRSSRRSHSGESNEPSPSNGRAARSAIEYLPSRPSLSTCHCMAGVPSSNRVPWSASKLVQVRDAIPYSLMWSSVHRTNMLMPGRSLQSQITCRPARSWR